MVGELNLHQACQHENLLWATILTSELPGCTWAVGPEGLLQDPPLGVRGSTRDQFNHGLNQRYGSNTPVGLIDWDQDNFQPELCEARHHPML